MNPAALLLSKIDINKLIIYILVIIALIITYLGIKKMIKKHRNNKAIKELGKDVNVSKLTYPLSYYPLWAGELFDAMDGAGTNEDVIFKIFGKLQTKHDVLQLITDFGVKDSETLTQWLIGDLSEDDRATLNRLMSDKNINYQF